MSSEGAMEKELSSGELSRALMEFLMFVARCALLLYPVFACGAFGLSVSWLLLTVLLWGLWEKNRRRKFERVDAAIDFVDNEFHVIKNEMMKALNSPTWVGKARGRGLYYGVARLDPVTLFGVAQSTCRSSSIEKYHFL